MRSRSIRLCAVTMIAPLAAVALALPAADAGAAPVTREAFYATLTSAISQSGPLVPGTTLVYRESEVSGPGAKPDTRADVVNPDGSLTLRRSTAGRVREVRCVAFDRCWERVTDSRSDRRWHRLMAGAIRITTIIPDFVTPTADLWPGDATFDDVITPAGTRQLTARYASLNGTTVDRYTIDGPRVTRAVSLVGAEDAVQASFAATFESQPVPTKVTAPRKRALGRPFTAKRTPGPSYVRQFEAYANISS